MMNPNGGEAASVMETQSSALVVSKQKGGREEQRDGRGSQSKEFVRCDYCNKPYHTREQCWDLHGKPANFKPKSQRGGQRGGQNKATHLVESNAGSTSNVSFLAEQIDLLRRLLNQAKPANTAPGGAETRNPIAATTQCTESRGSDAVLRRAARMIATRTRPAQAKKNE